MRNFVLPDDAVVLGFGPGGGHSFGAAVLSRSEFAVTTVGCVRDALAWAIERCGDQVPMAAGLDALLHWSDEPNGWRPADRALRTAYPRVRSSVVSPNGPVRRNGDRRHGPGVQATRALARSGAERDPPEGSPFCTCWPTRPARAGSIRARLVCGPLALDG